MQIAFFPVLDTEPVAPDEEVTALEEMEKGEEGSDISVTGSVFSYNTVNSIWDDVAMAPPDAILGIAQAYKACQEPSKVNVCVGAYRTCFACLE